MTYDPSTDEGKVRLLISDVGGQSGNSFLFSDAEISAFLAMQGSVPLAAAQALRAIAGNEAQVSKRITFLDLQTDGAEVARSLLTLADKIEAGDDVSTDIDIAQMGLDQFSRRELRGL